MKLTTVSAAYVLLFSSLVQSAPLDTNDTTPSSDSIAIELDEALTAWASQYTVDNLVARGEGLDELVSGVSSRVLPLVREALLLVADPSKIVNAGLDAILLHPRLLQTAADATIFILKSNLINWADLTIALEKSGLGGQLLHLFLTDPKLLPGTLNIGRNLLSEENVHLFKRSQDDSEGYQFGKRESKLLDQIFVFVRETGTIPSATQHLLTTPELAQPIAHFLALIINSHAISIEQILQSFGGSGFLLDTLRKLFANSEHLAQLGKLIAERIAHDFIGGPANGTTTETTAI